MDSTDKLMCTEETDFVILSYDPSDIEEIEENEESLKSSQLESSINNQHDDDDTPSSSTQIDVPQSSEIITNENTVPEYGEELIRKRIHSSQPECLSIEPEIENEIDEPVGTSLIKCSREEVLSNEDEEDNDDDSDSEPGDNEEENGDLIDDAYFMLEDDVGQEDEIMDLRTIKRPRVYRHAPNSMMNLRLDLMVCFAITAGVFLGLGNYLGYSSHWSNARTLIALNNDNVAKLKDLQDKLAGCLNSQSKLEPVRQEINTLKPLNVDGPSMNKFSSYEALAHALDGDLPLLADKKKEKEKRSKYENMDMRKKKDKKRKKERKGEKSKFDREYDRRRTREGLKGEKT